MDCSEANFPLDYCRRYLSSYLQSKVSYHTSSHRHWWKITLPFYEKVFSKKNNCEYFEVSFSLEDVPTYNNLNFNVKFTNCPGDKAIIIKNCLMIINDNAKK